jgi:hypothetical protein
VQPNTYTGDDMKNSMVVKAMARLRIQADGGKIRTTTVTPSHDKGHMVKHVNPLAKKRNPILSKDTKTQAAFKDLTKEGQEKYLKDHPNSKYGKGSSNYEAHKEDARKHAGLAKHHFGKAHDAAYGFGMHSKERQDAARARIQSHMKKALNHATQAERHASKAQKGGEVLHPDTLKNLKHYSVGRLKDWVGNKY